MPNEPDPLSLVLQKVRTRLWICALARRMTVLLIVLASLLLVGLLIIRLLGLGSGGLALWTWTWLVPATLVMVTALAPVRPPDRRTTARFIDRSQHNEDLFLTAAGLDPTAPGFAPLVRRRAESAAACLRPALLVPWRWPRHLVWPLGLLLVVGLSWRFLPSLDPFGRRAGQEALQSLRQELTKQTTLERQRIEVLRQDPFRGLSPAVEAEMKALLATLGELERRPVPQNDAALRQHQQQLGRLDQEQRQRRLAEALERQQTAQQLGGEGSETDTRAQRQLQQGDASGMQERLAELQRQLDDLKRDPQAAAGAKQNLQRQVEALRRTLNQGQAMSPALDQALSDLANRLARAQDPAAAQEALDAAQTALDLAGLQAQALARDLRDLAAVKKMLAVARQAREANGQGACPSGAVPGQGLDAYAQLYEQMRRAGGAGSGQGAGEGQGQGRGGTGGQGQGQGGRPGEDDTTASAFKPEMDPSQARAGKVLMQWRSQEEAPKGEAQRALGEAVRTVKDGVGEAILREEIPAGYHQAIRRYFDDLTPAPAKPPADGPTIP